MPILGLYAISALYSSIGCADVLVVKELREAITARTMRAIAAMKPKLNSRMGPAIRHTVNKLVANGNTMKVLVVISDGFPQDCDDGPARNDHEYGVQDTAKALLEAPNKCTETSCMTVGRSGHDYLKRMCPDTRYMVIEEMEDFPGALSKVYGALTGRLRWPSIVRSLYSPGYSFPRLPCGVYKRTSDRWWGTVSTSGL